MQNFRMETFQWKSPHGRLNEILLIIDTAKAILMPAGRAVVGDIPWRLGRMFVCCWKITCGFCGLKCVPRKCCFCSGQGDAKAGSPSSPAPIGWVQHSNGKRGNPT